MKRGFLALAVVCLVVVLLSAVGLVWDFATRLEFNIDGLLLLLVCLMMGGIFSLMILLLAKEAGWAKGLPFRGKKSAADSPAGNPGKPPAGEGK